MYPELRQRNNGYKCKSNEVYNQDFMILFEDIFLSIITSLYKLQCKNQFYSESAFKGDPGGEVYFCTQLFRILADKI